MFTARYALSSYIRQIRFVFKGLCRTSLAYGLHLPQRSAVPFSKNPQRLKRTPGEISNYTHYKRVGEDADRTRR